MTREIDEGFIGRVYRTSIVVWAVGVVCWWGTLGFPAAAGWTVGSALSMGALRGFEWLALGSFVPGSTTAKRDFTKFAVIKLPIVVLILAAVVLIGGRSLPVISAFCAGVILTQTVILLKTIGAMIAARLGR